MVWQQHANASTSGRVPQGALALAFFADAHWQKRLPPDETGEARKLRRWIAHRMDMCKWIGLALLLLQVRLIMEAGHVLATARLCCHNNALHTDARLRAQCQHSFNPIGTLSCLLD